MSLSPLKLKSKAHQQSYTRINNENSRFNGGNEDPEFDLNYDQDEGNGVTAVDYLHESEDDEDYVKPRRQDARESGTYHSALNLSDDDDDADDIKRYSKAAAIPVKSPVISQQLLALPAGVLPPPFAEDQLALTSLQQSARPNGSIQQPQGVPAVGDGVQSIFVAFFTCRCSSIPALFTYIRSESRRKRVERAMALEDTTEGTISHLNGTIMLCLSSWCDLSEYKGMMVAVAFLLIWGLSYHFLDQQADSPEDEALRDLVLVSGISLVAIRCLWWPVYWYVWGRRVQKRRQANMELYDGLNGDAAAGCGLDFAYDADDEMGLEICEETGRPGIVV